MNRYKLNNNNDEILKLKKGLMTKRRYYSSKIVQKRKDSSNIASNISSDNISRSNKSARTLTSEIWSYINDDKGKLFEHNIRQTLEYELKWNIAGEREFNYRKIITSTNYYIITETKSLLLKLNDNLFRFKLKKNGICYVSDGIDKFELKADKEYLLGRDLNIKIEKTQSLEMDGFYLSKGIKLPIFNPEETSIIYNFLDGKTNLDRNNNDIAKRQYNNISDHENEECIENSGGNEISNSGSDSDCDDDEGNREPELGDFKYVVVEIKLSKTKIGEMIEQIKRDKEVMEKIIKDKILYLGFVNSENINRKSIKDIKGINFILFGIKNSQFYGRDILHYLDWNLIKKVDTLSEKIDNIERKLDILIKSYNRKNAKKSYFLGKKRRMTRKSYK